jgi:hypothetical protein
VPGKTTATGQITIAEFNAQTFQGGTKIYFQSGATYSGNFNLKVANASKANPVVVDILGGSALAVIQAPGTTPAFTVTTPEGVEIHNLALRGSGVYGQEGVFVRATSGVIDDIQLWDLDISGFNNNGIYVDADGTSTITGLQIRNSRKCTVPTTVGDPTTATGSGIYNNLAAIYLYGGSEGNAYRNSVGAADTTHYRIQGAVIDGLCIYSNVGYDNYSWGGIFLQFNTGTLVQNLRMDSNCANEVYAKKYGKQGTNCVGVQTSQTKGTIVQYNEISLTRGVGADGDAIDFDWGSVNNVAQYNYLHNNDGAGVAIFDCDGYYPTTGNVARYNLSVSDGLAHSYGGITLYDYNLGGNHVNRSAKTPRATEFIYNNTVYNTNSTGAIAVSAIHSSTWDITFMNNLLISDSASQATIPLIGIGSLVSGDLLGFQGNAYWAKDGKFYIHDNQLAATKTFSSLSTWAAEGTREGLPRESVNGQSLGIDLTNTGQLPDLCGINGSSEPASNACAGPLPGIWNLPSEAVRFTNKDVNSFRLNSSSSPLFRSGLATAALPLPANIGLPTNDVFNQPLFNGIIGVGASTLNPGE